MNPSSQLPTPVMSAGEVEHLIQRGFGAERAFFHVEHIEPGRASVRMPFRGWMVRPGDVISGPALFSAADLAMYALVLSHVGPELMAVTSNLNLNFLNKGRTEDIHGQARFLKLGRKLAVMEVELRCGEDPTLVALATGSYSLPASTAARRS